MLDFLHGLLVGQIFKYSNCILYKFLKSLFHFIFNFNDLLGRFNFMAAVFPENDTRSTDLGVITSANYVKGLLME